MVLTVRAEPTRHRLRRPRHRGQLERWAHMATIVSPFIAALVPVLVALLLTPVAAPIRSIGTH